MTGVQTCALPIYGTNIVFLANPTYQNKLDAVTNDGMALQYISNPTEELCTIAVNNNIESLEFVPPQFFPANTKEYRQAIDKLQDNVIIDDLDVNHAYMGYHLKIWTDKFSFLAEVKNSTVVARPKSVMYLSNNSKVSSRAQNLRK